MYSVILLSLVGLVASGFVSVRRDEEVTRDEGWKLWKSAHNKGYTDLGEEKVRYAIWKDNLRRIVEFNEKSTSVFLAMNHFGDMTNTEYRATMTGYVNSREEEKGSSFLPPSNIDPPQTVDWRTKGMVTPIKNQKQCGSCWAFSATGSLEGQHQKKTGKLVSLSEQQLVDCSRKFGNYGCNGGLMDNAFRYIKANGGIDTEESYPYVARNEKCHFNKSTIGATVTGFVDIESGSEDALLAASATIGPISVAIDASHFSFQFYHHGVYDEPHCSSRNLDHGVLLVGYGVSDDGKKYWLVKNSWGTSWGDKGYIMMSRDKHNQCGIATASSYPLV